MWANSKKQGFTIVELLIVVVVIGVLAAIVIVAYNGITASANDSKRVSDLRSLAKVIEIYKVENGGYPRCGATGPNTTPSLSSGTAQSCLADELVPNYIGAIPVDPTNSGSYIYRYAAGYVQTGPTAFDGTPATDNFILGVRLEGTTSPTYSGWGLSDLTYLTGS